jgi:hypothetical protein
MALSYIDPWALFGIYNTDAYLAPYAPAYGFIASHVSTIALYIIDLVIWNSIQQNMDARSKTRIGFIVAIALVVIYAAIGYPIFGWILAYAFKKNPNTPLGPIGNILAYTMYGLIMLLSLITATGSNYFLSQAEKTAMGTRRDNITLTKGRISKWCTVNFIACAVFLGTAIHRQYKVADPTLLSNTFILLATNRFLELVLQFNTNTFQDSTYVEGGYLHHFMCFLFGETSTVKERYTTTDVTKTHYSLPSFASKKTGSVTTMNTGGTTGEDSSDEEDTSDEEINGNSKEIADKV